MIRYLLLSSGFILASTLTFTASANAQEVFASGIVAKSCTFTQSVPGELILNSGGTTLTSTGGTPAKVDINCNGDATLTISEPVQNSGSGTTVFTTLSATANNGVLGLNVSSKSASPGNILAKSKDENAIGTIEVNMVADNGSQKISPGKYNFTVTLTSTP